MYLNFQTSVNKSFTALVLAIALVLSVFAGGVPLYAAEDVQFELAESVSASPAALAVQEIFYPGDIIAFNRIITEHNLHWIFTLGNEDGSMEPDWGGRVRWNEENPKRIVELGINGMRLQGHLDVSEFTSLQHLLAFENQLTSLDVSGLTELDMLFIWWNDLTNLDLSGLTALTVLNVSDNRLTELDVSELTSLEWLTVGWNQLTELDISRLTSLTRLDVRWNELTELDVSGLVSLERLNVEGNWITNLDVSELTELTMLDVRSNLLTNLNLSGLTALNSVEAWSNLLTDIDVSGLTALTRLNLRWNRLTTLDVSGLPLWFLDVGDNYMTSPDDIIGLRDITWLGFYPQRARPIITTIPDAVASPGALTTVNINITNNPGFAEMGLDITFPAELTLVDYEVPDGLEEGFSLAQATNSASAVWNLDVDFEENGTILSLTFEVHEDAVIGTRHPIELTAHFDGNVVIENDYVTVLRYRLGDVTGDGRLSMVDITRLARHIAHDVNVSCRVSADVNSDDNVNLQDITLLGRYIMRHPNISLGPSWFQR